MKIDRLSPLPDNKTQFAWSHHATLPEQSGCYALATYAGDVLYVGLATTSVRARIGAHLDSPLKRQGAVSGVPFWVYYILRSPLEVGPVERGWMNQSILEDGEMPPLNRVYSPI